MNKNLVHGLWIGNNRLTQFKILDEFIYYEKAYFYIL